MNLPRAISFSDFVEYGRNNGANIVNGMPWSFEFEGYPVTHENDSCYLIGNQKFTPDVFMVVTPKKKLIFMRD
jgi:hypothetical protein